LPFSVRIIVIVCWPLANRRRCRGPHPSSRPVFGYIYRLVSIATRVFILSPRWMSSAVRPAPYHGWHTRPPGTPCCTANAVPS
jgi:hypothetical protein